MKNEASIQKKLSGKNRRGRSREREIELVPGSTKKRIKVCFLYYYTAHRQTFPLL